MYVTTELDNAIAVIDADALKIIDRIPTDQAESHMLAISSDERRGYSANVGPGTVSVLDLKAKKTLAVIPVCGNTQDHFLFTPVLPPSIAASLGPRFVNACR